MVPVILGALLLLLPAPAPAQAATASTSGGGALLIEPRHDLLDSLGLRLGKSGRQDALTLPLLAAAPLTIALGDGAPTAALGGRMAVGGLLLAHHDRRAPPLWLVPAEGAGLGFDLVDGQGAAWLRIGHAMRSPDLRDGLRFYSADLRVGPALAAWTGTDSEGLLAGRIELRIPLALPAGSLSAASKSCPAPNWPTAGFTTDVRLVSIDRITPLRCRVLGSGNGCGGSAFTCDGPGGEEGEVVFVPDATLRNSDTDDTADVPWYRKFTAPQLPYGNDQHPYLVWNMYRLDADGTLLQIARSGLKHAFATANLECHPDAKCPHNGNILGRACKDLYDAASNDMTGALAPRAEVVPSTGQWGRCGSVFDDILNDGSSAPGCDGLNDPPPADDCYRYRMVARESDIDPALHPGARWFIDAWYVVRDDVDIFNSMGWREIHPTWRAELNPPHWHPGTPGAFTSGSIVDLWLEHASLAERTARSVVSTSDGQVVVAARVRREGAQWRYDYHVANYDLTRATTEGMEPNLRIISHDAVDAVAVVAVNGATASASGFADGDANTANDWTSDSGSITTWSAPTADAQLDWGHLVAFSLLSAHPPGGGELRLAHAATGDPGEVSASTLVPDGEKVFFDRFE